ncbi:MAG: hypothetical protein ACYTGX_09335 [Planctomycetota bacterium]|jgi:hypothetical protein
MRAALLLAAAALAAFATGCTTLHPTPPEFSPQILQRLAPQFPPLASASKSKGVVAFTDQREAADQAVEEVLKIAPAVTFTKDKPVTLAIAEVGPDGVETIRKEEKDAWRAALEKTGLVRVVFISSVILSGDPRFHEIRIAAARLRADAVFLYASATSRAEGGNLGALLYLTIVGAAVVPGSHGAVLTFSKGVCFDVKNEFLQFAVEGEDERAVMRPWLFRDTDGMERASVKAAVEVLRGEMVRALTARAATGG